MSSILKALKKAESAPAHQPGIKPFQHDPDITELIRHSKQARRYSPRLATMVALLVVSGAAWVSLDHIKTGVDILPAPAAEHSSQSVEIEQKNNRPEYPIPAMNEVNIQTVQGTMDYSSTTVLGKEDTSQGKVKLNEKISKERVIPQPPKISANRLDESVMKLQAITWAIKPEERFALIDNKIVRPGDTVKDYSIESIHENHILFKKGMERWRLDFRIR